MTRWTRLCLCLILAAGLSACEGARQAGSGAKKVGGGILTVFQYPSKMLAGTPPNYAEQQGMTEADLVADAPPDVDKDTIKKRTQVKPALMRPGF